MVRAYSGQGFSAGNTTFHALLLGTLGALLLPGMDAFAKLLGEREIMSPGQLTFFRFFIQMVASALILMWIGGLPALKIGRFWINFLRGALLGIASLFFFIAIKYMPLPDAIAVFFVEPLILTLLSFIVLREKVGWRRIVAVVAGFCGAILVIQPSYAIFGWVALLPLVTATLFAIYMLLNRVAGQADSALSMQWVSGLGGSAVILAAMLVALPFGGGDMAFSFNPEWSVWGLVLVMGSFGLVGHYLFVRALQLAPASVIAPLQYLEIVSAALFGYFMFAEFPTFWKWVGVVIIVISGLFVFQRENADDQA
ncbi:MAG: DMT family transporter [Pseudomonadota bacterium]